MYRFFFAGRYAFHFLGCIAFIFSAAAGPFVFFSAAQSAIGFYLAPPRHPTSE